MTPSAPVAHPSSALTAQLGLSGLLFSRAERAIAKKVDAGLELVESGLLDEVRFTDSVADSAARYLLSAGGKRVRPLLTLVTAQLGDGAIPDVIVAAKAIEITHLGSLYHDDVMDEADQRRGVPSAHAVWSNSVAILTGDLLFARASQLMGQLGERAIKLQADTFERLVLGQLRETVGPSPDDAPIDHYIGVLADKTGSLIAAAAQAGVVFSNGPEEFVAPVREFGEKIGIAFQLVDDVIDLSPQPEETGKIAGTDLRAGVVTLPLLRLREFAATDAAAASLVEFIETSVVGAEALDPGVAAAVAELRAHEATAMTLAEAERWAADAVAALDPLPKGPVKKALTKFAATMLDRSN